MKFIYIFFIFTNSTYFFHNIFITIYNYFMFPVITKQKKDTISCIFFVIYLLSINSKNLRNSLLQMYKKVPLFLLNFTKIHLPYLRMLLALHRDRLLYGLLYLLYRVDELLYHLLDFSYNEVYQFRYSKLSHTNLLIF